MNMNRFLLLSFTLISTGCASTYLIDKDGKTNYRISTVSEKEGLKASNFDGNQYTPVSRSYDYSRLGAILECSQQNKLALILETSDRTSRFTQLETTTTVTPIRTRGGVFYHSYSNTVPRTTTYPHHATTFKCVEKLQTIEGVTFETLNKEIVNPYTGDFKGGVLVKETGTNKILQVNDLIVKVNNERVENALSLTLLATDLPSKATLDIYRGKKPMKVTVNLTDDTEALKAQLAKETSVACEQVRKDEGKVPTLCAAPRAASPTTTSPVEQVDESNLSNREIKRLRNQQNNEKK